MKTVVLRQINWKLLNTHLLCGRKNSHNGNTLLHARVAVRRVPLLHAAALAACRARLHGCDSACARCACVVQVVVHPIAVWRARGRGANGRGADGNAPPRQGERALRSASAAVDVAVQVHKGGKALGRGKCKHTAQQSNGKSLVHDFCNCPSFIFSLAIPERHIAEEENIRTVENGPCTDPIETVAQGGRHVETKSSEET